MSASGEPIVGEALALSRSEWRVLLLVACWIIAALAGVCAIWTYELSPGATRDAPREWPTASAIVPSRDRATLVMLAHPKCPCTRASLEELAGLMAETEGRLAARVLFARPADVEPGWELSATWAQANAIPGVVAAIDRGGVEADRFGATVSGHTVVYDAAGHLIFQGGITQARGHAGDNAGHDRVRALVMGRSAARHSSPSFGCAMKSQNARAETAQ